jgi:hypothetical protein
MTEVGTFRLRLHRNLMFVLVAGSVMQLETFRGSQDIALGPRHKSAFQSD